MTSIEWLGTSYPTREWWKFIYLGDEDRLIAWRTDREDGLPGHLGVLHHLALIDPTDELGSLEQLANVVMGWGQGPLTQTVDADVDPETAGKAAAAIRQAAREAFGPGGQG